MVTTPIVQIVNAVRIQTEARPELDLESFRLPQRLAFDHDLQRGLLQWVQSALKPAAKDLGNAWDLHALRRS